MADTRAARLAELVKSAIERGSEERAAFLDKECESDPAMRAEIESLLEQQEGASRFIEEPALYIAAESLVREGAFRAGQTIGDYEIVSLVGRGGMGEVYLAQDRQLHRKVALKLIRRGMDSEDIVRHFKREEHLLASLNHPNIAQLYGGGVSTDEIPFFAMEYVEGERLDEYCDERGLGTKERLQLFRKVCSAVTYAHQHLVIHRDLKPANIRVTKDGEPKLLDFGIAKLLDSENAPSSGQTVTLQGVMTPDYASPEQVKGETMTTASDTYSLGVILYRLLTGQSPYRTKTNRPDEIARAITDQDPERPSTVVLKAESESDHESPITNHDSRSLRGDLDNIVLRAIRKESERRYSSVAQFSEDIRRHLDGLPVIARKDTLAYRSSKFIKRNRIGVIAAAFVTLILVGGVVSTTWEARRAEALRVKAEKRFNDVRGLAHSFLFEIEPQIQYLHGATGARQTLVKRALEYLDSLAKEAGDDRSLQHELATAYWKVGNIQGKLNVPNLGDTKGAVASYGKAQAIFERLLAAEPTDRAVQRDLAYTYQYLGNVLAAKTHDRARELENQRKAVAIFEGLAKSDPPNPQNQLDLVKGYDYLATTLAGDAFDSHSVEQQKKAMEVHRHAIAIAETLSATDPPNREFLREVGASYLRIGYTLNDFGDWTGEMSNYRLALEYNLKAQKIYERLAEADPTNMLQMRDAADAGFSVGYTQLKLEDAVGAVETLRKSCATFKALVEADPLNQQAGADLGEVSRYIGQAFTETGDLKSALEYSRQSFTLLNGVSNIDDRLGLIQIKETIGGLLARMGDSEGAIASCREALAILEARSAAEPANWGTRHATALVYSKIGSVYAMIAVNSSSPGKKPRESWSEARRWYQRSLDIWQELQAQSSLDPPDEGRYSDVIKEINKCDLALAKP